MDKYKIVGITDLFLGVGLILSSLAISLIVKSSLSTFAEVSQVPTSNNNLLTSIIVIAVGIVNVFIGFKLFSSSQATKNKYFMWGIVVAVLSIFALGFSSSFAILDIFSPLNNLYSQ